MRDALERFIELAERSNPAAQRMAFPVFTRGLGEETPLDSSPYVMRHDEFDRTFGGTPRRRSILGCLDALVCGARDEGVEFEILLIGGSFLRLSSDPVDLDCLGFYSLAAGADDEALPRWLAMLEPGPVDLKVCPADAGPLVLLKRGIFFSNLYAYDRTTGSLDRGGLLLEVRRSEGRNRQVTGG